MALPSYQAVGQKPASKPGEPGPYQKRLRIRSVRQVLPGSTAKASLPSSRS